MRFLMFFCFGLLAFHLSAQPEKKSPQPTKGDRKELLEIRRASLGLVIPDDAVWINTKRSRILHEEGRLFLAATWSPSDIRCRDVIHEIELLRKDYPELQVVLFVVPQNKAEEDIELIKKQVLIQNVNYPVAFLKSRKGLEMLNFDCFPNSALVRDDGTPMLQHCGEGLDKAMGEKVRNALQLYRQAGFTNTDAAGMLDFEDRLNYAKAILGYPTFMSLDKGSERLMVASTGTHKILILSLSGEILDVIGSGKQGFTDGSFESCSFNQPMGLAYDSNSNHLYIADTENHSIRMVDLVSRTVKTVLGNGLQSTGYVEEFKGSAGGLNYPWDIEMSGNQLLISMAGDHALWSMDLNSYSVKRVAGDGTQGEIDGKNKKAQLSQPAGLSADNLGNIYITIPDKGKVKRWNRKKIADVSPQAPEDEKQDTIKLSFPQGITLIGNDTWIADTYHNRIVKRDKEGIYSVAAGNGKAGWVDGKGEKTTFNLPWDIVQFNGLIYISDTYSNLIRILEPESGTVTTLALSNTKVATEHVPSIQERSSSIFLDEIMLAEGDNLLRFTFEIPEEYELVPGGRNEAYLVDNPFNQLLSFSAFEGEMVINAEGFPKNVNCSVELYLEYRLKERPETRYFRACRVFIPFIPAEPDAELNPEIKFKPLDLIAY